MSSSCPEYVRVDVPWLTILKILAATALVWIWLQIWPIVMVVLVSLVLAVTLEPVVEWLKRRRFTRGLALHACSPDWPNGARVLSSGTRSDRRAGHLEGGRAVSITWYEEQVLHRHIGHSSAASAPHACSAKYCSVIVPRSHSGHALVSPIVGISGSLVDR
jgi:hypothetical protein